MSYVNDLKESLSLIYGDPIVVILLTLFLLVATISDIKNLKIPNWLNGSLLAVRFLIIPLIGFRLGDILGALLSYVALLIPAMIKMQKMGGDLKLVAVMGLFLGIWLSPVFLVLSVFYMGLTFLIFMLIGKRASVLPFAPFFFLSHITFLIIHLCIL